MSKTCQPVKVKWWKVINKGNHEYIGESECVELEAGLYFELDGNTHYLTATEGDFESFVSWDLTKLDLDEVVAANGDERKLLGIYNKTYGKNICCPPKGFADLFSKLIGHGQKGLSKT